VDKLVFHVLLQEESTMKKLTFLVGAVRYVVLPIALCLYAPVCLAQAQGAGIRADVAELLKKHDNALNQHNLEGVLALYAPSPKTTMLGTGPGEKFQGKEEIKAAYSEIFKDFDRGTLTHSCYWKDGAGSGNVVWGAAMCKFSDAKGEKKREYELNVSMVAEKQGGKWQFVLLHYSNLVGNVTNQ
jgi:uncharacterized protein (TIGR02246 family)